MIFTIILPDEFRILIILLMHFVAFHASSRVTEQIYVSDNTDGKETRTIPAVLIA